MSSGPKNITSNSSSSGASQWTPYSGTQDAYGYALGNATQMGMSPVPFFPGATYTGPSQMTQQGLNMMGDGRYMNAINEAARQQGQAVPYYNMAATRARQADPYYREAAKLGGQAIPFFQDAAGMYRDASGLQEKAAQEYQNAIPMLKDIQGTAMGNYNFLSNAADVANNPYVQDMLKLNSENVNQALTESWLPALGKGAMQVNAMGNDRLGIAQGLTGQRAGQELSQANRQMLMDSYNTGVGAQTNALGMTGAMQQGALAPGSAYGLAGGALGQGGNFLGLGGQSHQMAGQTAGWMGDQTMNAANAWGQGGQYVQGASNAQQNRANILAGGAQGLVGAGQQVEGYQNQALQDAMARYAYQYSEPQQRMQQMMNMMQYFQPMGSQYQTSYGSGIQPNPGYKSPWQTGLGLAGMAGGFMLGGPAGAMAGGALGNTAGGMI